MILLKIHAPQFDKEPELLGLIGQLLLGRLMMGTKERALTALDTGIRHRPTVLDAGDQHC